MDEFKLFWFILITCIIMPMNGYILTSDTKYGVSIGLLCIALQMPYLLSVYGVGK